MFQHKKSDGMNRMGRKQNSLGNMYPCSSSCIWIEEPFGPPMKWGVIVKKMASSLKKLYVKSNMSASAAQDPQSKV